MTKYNDNDFVEIEYDIHANGNLVQTTDEKKGKAANLDIKEYGPQVIILGKGFIVKALDEDIKSSGKASNKLELKPEDAYGKRKKDLIRTFPKSSFDEQKIRAVPGVTYDFNGMYGTVKSVNGGRVMVDFNNPLSGKDIKIEYKINKKVEDIKVKIETVFNVVLRIPENMFEIEVKDKNINLSVPSALVSMKDMLVKSIEEFVSEIKDYKVELVEKK